MQSTELLGAKHAERFEYLRADFVLSAVAACRGRERGPVALTAIQHHQQAVVLIVGMGGGVEKDAGIGQMSQREPKRDVAFLFIERDDPHLRTRNRQRRDHQGG